MSRSDSPSTDPSRPMRFGAARQLRRLRDGSVRRRWHRHRRAGRLCAAAILCATVASGLMLLPGCAAAVVADAIGVNWNKAVYTLEDKPTLVFIQVHPGAMELFGLPDLKARIAAVIERDLSSRGKLTKVLDQSSLHEVAARDPLAFSRMSIDAIGRRVGAAQVVIVDIEQAVLRSQPGIVEPYVQSRVRVISTDPARRLFPVDPHQPNDPSMQPAGHAVITEMRPRQIVELEARERSMIVRALAELVARDVARKFYNWNPNDPVHQDV